jgi:hypothetical protein
MRILKNEIAKARSEAMMQGTFPHAVVLSSEDWMFTSPQAEWTNEQGTKCKILGLHVLTSPAACGVLVVNESLYETLRKTGSFDDGPKY